MLPPRRAPFRAGRPERSLRAAMPLLRSIQRSLLRSAFSPVAVDDFRTWTGATTLVASWHLAREVERRSKAQNIGILLPTSGMFAPALLGTWMAGRTAVPLNYLLSRADLLAEDRKSTRLNSSHSSPSRMPSSA